MRSPITATAFCALQSILLFRVQALIESCTSAIDRMKAGPAEFPDIIKSGRKYEDETFNGRDLLFWWGYTEYTKIKKYEQDLFNGRYGFQHIKDAHPSATMWGDNNPSWHDIVQGQAGTCYIAASLGAIAEFPEIVKNVFITQETNEAGIYAFRFFIRGKPWIVTVDDVFMFTTNNQGERQAVFSSIGKYNQFWAMLLEKAWAKMKGNYELADGGFVQNGLRALVGCPIISYRTSETTADTTFQLLKSANDANYIMGAGTIGLSDSFLNQCGIPQRHAFSLIATLELKTGATVDHKLYMMRNPWGISFFNKTWNSGDTASWTADYRAQVPYGVDPLTSQNDGIFFVSHTDFQDCLYDYQIAIYRDNEGYSDDWYDKEKDKGETLEYEVTLPAKNGDLYFTVESYFQGMVPDSCWTGEYPVVKFTLYKNTKAKKWSQYWYYDAYHKPAQILESEYEAGDKIILEVTYDWFDGYSSIPESARDYTIKVYSKQNLEIKSSATGKTNMWFMDGQFPSRFTRSHYRTPTLRWTPEWQPRSLSDIWLISNNVQEFVHYVWEYPWTLYVWTAE